MIGITQRVGLARSHWHCPPIFLPRNICFKHIKKTKILTH